MHLMKNSIKITFLNQNNDQQEILMAKLSIMFNPQGYEQNETSLIAFFEEGELNADDLEAFVKEHDLAIESSIIAAQNWNAVWESNFDPVYIDDFCAVRAHFHAPITSVKHEILITPKMSFGTGHHATTYLVMKQMAAIVFNSKSVCDFGTGTGVLAILAHQLGAKSILAIDNDDWSIDNAKENFGLNHCTTIKLVKAEQIIANTYNIILANINKNVLLANMILLKKALTIDGILVLSGVLNVDLEDMQESLTQHQMQLISVSEKSNWLCINAKHI
jgi:ribosomal protein L11 methyltransferase